MQKTSIFGTLAMIATLAVATALNLSAQTAPPTPAKPVHKPVARTASTTMKLPPNIPVVKGLMRTAFALQYIEIKPGVGALAEPGQRYTVHYTGWLHDGTKFDSSVDRGTPIDFVQGSHHVIPGWDEGFAGMRIGGKRRLFIPWQLAYGATGRGPIPPRADLIFDIELVNATEPNAPPAPAAPPAAPAPKPDAPK